MARDPVCGMTVEPSEAADAAREEFEGKTFYFCSAECQRTFQAEPTKYAAPGAQPKGCGACGCKGMAAGN